jgi:hypothetical protein
MLVANLTMEVSYIYQLYAAVTSAKAITIQSPGYFSVNHFHHSSF